MDRHTPAGIHPPLARYAHAVEIAAPARLLSIVAGVIAVLFSFDEVTMTAFLTTAQSRTLPVRIYAEAAFSLENTVNAVSTLIIVATCVLLLAVKRVVRLDRMWHR